MFEETIDTISNHEWEDAIAAHLAWGAIWHGDLPAGTFFGIWASLAREAKPLVVTVRLDTPEPTIAVPPGSPLTVEGNHVLLDDGRELVFQFES